VRQIRDFQSDKRPSELLRGQKEVEGSAPGPVWNVAPTQNVPIVAERLDEGTLDRRLLVGKWGLVLSWAKDTKIGSKLINARSKSILEKSSLRSAAVKRRALQWCRLPGASHQRIL
jgi:putative SOS response-associated peptidase YedK